MQADGNVLVAPNGYPVYTSVHMNPTYFATARKNLIATGDYQKGQPNDTFPLGSAVFKATWLRLAPGEDPPAGAFVTQAQVPVLTVQRSATSITILPVPNKFVSAKVALVGLHVVGVTVNHPEFLWGTFEHKLNTPQVPDNTFSPSGSSSTGYTFYKANTSYGQANIAVTPPLLTFNTTTQRFSPTTNAVLENQTGGENQPGGPANVQSVSHAGADLPGQDETAAVAFCQLLSGRHGVDAAQQLQPQQRPEQCGRIGESRQYDGGDLPAVSVQCGYVEGQELLHVPQRVVLFVPVAAPGAAQKSPGRDQPHLVGRHGLRRSEHDLRQCEDAVLQGAVSLRRCCGAGDGHRTATGPHPARWRQPQISPAGGTLPSGA